MKTVSNGLAKVLADTYTVYLKTQNFHWNVKGPFFSQLHTLFGAQYEEMATAIDDIAERIRALGVAAPGSFRDFNTLKTIPEAEGVPTWKEMVRQLTEGQEAIVRDCEEVESMAAKVNDQATADLMIQRIQLHQKNAWMLRSVLEE